MTPFGAEAIEIARVEAGLIVTDYDYEPHQRSPLDFNLDRFVKVDKGLGFAGEEKLRALAADPPNRFVTLRYEADAVPEYGAAVTKDGGEVGVLTSPTDSPRFGKIGLAIVPTAQANVGNTLDVAVGDRTVTATVDVLPIYDTNKDRPARSRRDQAEDRPQLVEQLHGSADRKQGERDAAHQGEERPRERPNPSGVDHGEADRSDGERDDQRAQPSDQRAEPDDRSGRDHRGPDRGDVHHDAAPTGVAGHSGHEPAALGSTSRTSSAPCRTKSDEKTATFSSGWPRIVKSAFPASSTVVPNTTSSSPRTRSHGATGGEPRPDEQVEGRPDHRRADPGEQDQEQGPLERDLADPRARLGREALDRLGLRARRSASRACCPGRRRSSRRTRRPRTLRRTGGAPPAARPRRGTGRACGLRRSWDEHALAGCPAEGCCHPRTREENPNPAQSCRWPWSSSNRRSLAAWAAFIASSSGSPAREAQGSA